VVELTTIYFSLPRPPRNTTFVKGTLPKRHSFLSLYIAATSTNALENLRISAPSKLLASQEFVLATPLSHPFAEAEFLDHDMQCGAEALSVRLNLASVTKIILAPRKKATNPP
jgi:hypothetical protein